MRVFAAMTPELQVYNIADFHVHDSEEALVAFLELALIKNLNSDNRGVLDSAGRDKCMVGNRGRVSTHMSKLSFQYGFRVFLMTLVVCVCSASTVMTAKGSGSRKTSRFERPSAATTGPTVRS